MKTSSSKRANEQGGALEVEGATAASLGQSEILFRLAFEKSMAPMVFSDQNGLFLAVNDAFCKMTGRTREELIGYDSKHFTHPEDVGVSENVYQRLISGETDEIRYSKRFLQKDGTIVYAEVSFCSAHASIGEARYFVSSVRDVTEERALAAQLSFRALHDPLTGLTNRTLFDDRLEQAQSRATREGGLIAVLLIDLDDFKDVNDLYGHLVGDQLLIAIARRFESVARASDTLCRFGGDEFLYLAEGLRSTDEAALIAERLLGTLAEPMTFDGVTLKQGASVGVGVREDSADADVDIVKDADAAMYEAKRQGGGHFVVFNPEIRHEAQNRLSLVQELRHAVASGGFVMNYQPIIDLVTTDVVGFEALMRWPNPERGLVPPSVFIPLAEENDLILELGAFALHEAVTTARSWNLEGNHARSAFVTINLTARQFHDPGLVSMIEEELRQSGLEPERLILEVTEMVALLDISATIRIKEQLVRLGVGIALDDYGAGHSSLSHLATLRPRMIKIDQSFVRPRRHEERSDSVLEAIVTLSNRLDMIVLAEGIETPAQLDRLYSLDCDLGQGFLWSPAVSSADAAVMMERASSHRITPIHEEA